MISQSRIYVLGRCHDEIECFKFHTLVSFFRDVPNFFFSIELRYTCPVIDQRFGIATSTTGPSFLKKFAYNTVFVLWHCFAVTWRFAFLVNPILACIQFFYEVPNNVFIGRHLK